MQWEAMRQKYNLVIDKIHEQWYNEDGGYMKHEFDEVVEMCFKKGDLRIDCESPQMAIRTRFLFYNWRKREIRRRSRWTDLQLRAITIRLEGQYLFFTAAGLADGQFECSGIEVLPGGPPAHQFDLKDSSIPQHKRESETVLGQIGYAPDIEPSHLSSVLEELGYSAPSIHLTGPGIEVFPEIPSAEPEEIPLPIGYEDQPSQRDVSGQPTIQDPTAKGREATLPSLDLGEKGEG